MRFNYGEIRTQYFLTTRTGHNDYGIHFFLQVFFGIFSSILTILQIQRKFSALSSWGHKSNVHEIFQLFEVSAFLIANK